MREKKLNSEKNFFTDKAVKENFSSLPAECLKNFHRYQQNAVKKFKPYNFSSLLSTLKLNLQEVGKMLEASGSNPCTVVSFVLEIRKKQ